MSEFTNVFHSLHTKLGIKDSEKHLLLKYVNAYTGTSKMRWSSYTSSLLTWCIVMLSRLSRSLNRKKQDFGFGNPKQAKPSSATFVDSLGKQLNHPPSLGQEADPGAAATGDHTHLDADVAKAL